MRDLFFRLKKGAALHDPSFFPLKAGGGGGGAEPENYFEVSDDAEASPSEILFTGGLFFPLLNAVVTSGTPSQKVAYDAVEVGGDTAYPAQTLKTGGIFFMKVNATGGTPSPNDKTAYELVEVGAEGQTVPSATLKVGGIFLERV